MLSKIYSLSVTHVFVFFIFITSCNPQSVEWPLLSWLSISGSSRWILWSSLVICTCSRLSKHITRRLRCNNAWDATGWVKILIALKISEYLSYKMCFRTKELLIFLVLWDLCWQTSSILTYCTAIYLMDFSLIVSSICPLY